MSRRRVTSSSYAKSRMFSRDGFAVDADSLFVPLSVHRETSSYSALKGNGSQRLSPHRSDPNADFLEPKHRKTDRVFKTGSNTVPPVFDGVFWEEEAQEADKHATTESHPYLESFGLYSQRAASPCQDSFVSHKISDGFCTSPRNGIVSQYSRRCSPRSKNLSPRHPPTPSFTPRSPCHPLTSRQPKTCPTDIVERSGDWLDDLAARAFYPKMDVSELRKRWDTLTHLVWDKMPKTDFDTAKPSPSGPHQATEEVAAETSGFSGLLLGIEALKLATLKAAAAGQPATTQSPSNRHPVIEKSATITGSCSTQLPSRFLGRSASHNGTRPSAPSVVFPEDGESKDDDSDDAEDAATIIHSDKSKLDEPQRQRWGHGKLGRLSNFHTHSLEEQLLAYRRKLDRLQTKLINKKSQLKSQRRAFREAISSLQSERDALVKRLSVANDEREQQEITISKMALRLERKTKDLVLARYEKLRLRRLLRQATETLQRYAPSEVPVSSQQEPWRQSFSAFKIDSLGRRTPVSLRLVATHSGVLALWVRTLDGSDVLCVELSRLTRLVPLLFDRVHDSEALSSRCFRLQTASTDSLDVEFPNAEVATAFYALVLRLHRAALVAQRHQPNGPIGEFATPLIRPSKTCVLELQNFFLGSLPSQHNSYRLSGALLSRPFFKQRPMLTAPASATRAQSQQRRISVNRRAASSQFETHSLRDARASLMAPQNDLMTQKLERFAKEASFSSLTSCSSISSRACSPEQQPDFSKRHLDLFLDRLRVRAASARHALDTSISSGRHGRRSRSKGDGHIILHGEKPSSSSRSSISLASSQTRTSISSLDRHYLRTATRRASVRDQRLNSSSGRPNLKRKIARLVSRSRASNTTQGRPSYFRNQHRVNISTRSPLGGTKRPEGKFQSIRAELEGTHLSPSALLHLRFSSGGDQNLTSNSVPPAPPPQERPLLALEKVLLQEKHSSTSQSEDPDDTDSSESYNTTTLSSTGTPNSLQQNRHPLSRNFGTAVRTTRERSSSPQQRDTRQTRGLPCFETLHRCTETTQATTSSSVPSPLTNALGTTKSYTIQLEKPVSHGTVATPLPSHHHEASVEPDESYQSGLPMSHKDCHHEDNDSTISESSSPHATNVIFPLELPQ